MRTPNDETPLDAAHSPRGVGHFVHGDDVCQCATQQRLSKALNNADAIFVGEVVDIAEVRFPRGPKTLHDHLEAIVAGHVNLDVVTFQVIESLRGGLSDEVTVWTDPPSAMRPRLPAWNFLPRLRLSMPTNEDVQRILFSNCRTRIKLRTQAKKEVPKETTREGLTQEVDAQQAA